jgi:exopolysaccharide biosynthesis protein
MDENWWNFNPQKLILIYKNQKMETISKQISVLLILLSISLSANCQSIDLSKYQLPFNKSGIILFHLNSDSLFSEKQNIAVAEIKKISLRKYKFAIGFSDSALIKTSRFGEDANAVVSLNGGFFDVKKGGSVAYLESNGKVIARNRKAKDNWAKSDSLLNGAIVLDNSGRMIIEPAKNESYYERSNHEKSVLVSGPILLVNGHMSSLENSDFVNKRHPRSCLCETADKNILFIAIDGRSEVASGMNLKETQQFLLRLNCRNAINLDGGGSTSLWVNDGNEKRILNKPSDKTGERPVANVILITE